MESSDTVYADEKIFQHQRSDSARPTTSTVRRIRRGTSHAPNVGEAAGDITGEELEADVAVAFAAGSWSFPQPGCLPVISVGVLVLLLPGPLLPAECVVTGVGVAVTGVGGWL